MKSFCLKSLKSSKFFLFSKFKLPVHAYITQSFSFIQFEYPMIKKNVKVPKNIKTPVYIKDKEGKNIYNRGKGKPTQYSKKQIAKIRKTAKLLSNAADYVLKKSKKGTTTDQIDKLFSKYLISKKASPNVGYMDFPKALCASPNMVCCHGIPNGRKIQDGDFTNFDMTCYKNGVFADTSVMKTNGYINPQVQFLIEATQQGVYKSIKACKPGQKYSVIQDICSKIADKYSFHINEYFCGHGIGEYLHEPTQIMHTNKVGFKNKGVMKPGHIFTIEPIFQLTKTQSFIHKDNWTVFAKNSPSAQWEHMVLITKKGCEVLTKRKNEKIKLKTLNQPKNELTIHTVRKGDGKNFPKAGNTVEVNYVGKFLDNAEFDSSIRRKETFKFDLGQGNVIKGWDECVSKMSLGQKVILSCPPEFAYGETGAGGVIPPNETLQFEIELINFE